MLGEDLERQWREEVNLDRNLGVLYFAMRLKNANAMALGLPRCCQS